MKFEILTLEKPYSIEVKPKQKIIEINKLGNFIDLDANNQAQQDLSPCAYSLYMYLVKLVNGCVWALSNNEVNRKLHLSLHQYDVAVKELMNKGYLVNEPIDTGDRLLTKNTYHFYEKIN